jgi:D-arabinose 1-dehydrogenase-like Zn-dependent alcohol dehydrogenase
LAYTEKNRSDVHFWKRGRIGTLVFEGDCIIGHEAAGVVVRCGEGVTDYQPGAFGVESVKLWYTKGSSS